ncbi:translocation/assembly module TamB [Anaeromyxobacter oryzae]|uniref:Translocation/assembly module TamB n=1 Tax=Anaeromyxobacter oryzae TaxID=2918170 RepID=A0ABN6MUX6_9BACT|nr:translocation/assembly module TamB [Anaeromyxobacter oryzae]BDG04789.1 translocation/assembly module TamB [Anaeromyxobacter oryzae]
MAPSGSSGAPSRSPRRHKWLRRLSIGALSLVGLVLVVIAGALTYLASPSGGERLRALLVEKANATIEGALSVGALSLAGPHLVLRDVELRDPEGDLVAGVSGLEVRLRLAPLIRRRIDVAIVRLDAPELHLEQDDGGSNLQRAIAARTRTPGPEPETRGEGSSFGFVLEDLEIAGGVIDVVQRSADGTRHVHLDDLRALGSANKVGAALGARLEITAALAAPLEALLHLSVDATGAGERKDARVALELGAAALVATAHLDDERHVEARIESLVVPPEVARALAPGYPLRAPATLSAEAKRSGDELSLHLVAKAGSASARVEGTFDLAARRARAARLTVRHVDLSELTDRGPTSDVGLTLLASGGGTSLDDAVGRLELSVPPSPIAEETMGPVHVVASAADGEVQLRDLVVSVPGVRIEARGQGRKERLSFAGRLIVSDLDAFSRTIGKLVGPTGLSAKGQGLLEFALSGSTEAPSVEADGSFPVLTYEQTRVDGLALHLHVPNVKAPAGMHARLEARKVALAPRKIFRGVHLAVDGEGEELTLDAAVHGYAELSVGGRASLSPDGHGGTLRALALRYPEASWELEAPVRIESRPGVVAVSPFTLRSGDQVISARVLKRRTKLDAALEVRSLDLGRLPRAFVDPALGLGGVLNVRVRATGQSSKPDVMAQVDLRGGRFERYRELQLRVDAGYAGDVAKGTLAAKGQGVGLTGSFDVPVKALERGRRVPVKVELVLAELRLDEALRELGVETPVSGLVSARVSVWGTADDPRLRVALEGRRLRAKQLPPSDVDVTVESADAGRLRARADLALEGRKSFVEVRTPFTLGQLLRERPGAAALTAAEFALEADVRDLPLKLLSEAGMSTQPLDGTLSARAHATVSAAAPRGEVSLSAKRVGIQGRAPVDANVELHAGDDLRADVWAEQGGKPLLTAKARVGIGPKQLKDRARLAQAPLTLEANVGPLSLSQLQAAAQPANVDPAQAQVQVRGTLAGRLAVSGTVRDPRALLRVWADGLGAGDGPEGRVALSFEYGSAKETLDLLMRSQNGGELHATANGHLDLSHPSATRLDAAPIEATLSAKDFDPAFLAKLSGAVDRLGGLLYADARAGGTMTSPTVKGRIEWKDGAVFTHGSGSFTGMHLVASGDDRRMQLEELTAKSGKGTAKLSAVVERTGSGTFKIHAQADVDKLPVMSQGQLAATLSIRSTAEGEASPARIAIENLHIPEAHVQLPVVQRKDVQKLDDPPDVVLTLDGKPIRGSKTKSPQVVAATGTAGAAGTGSSASDGESPVPARPVTEVTVLVNAPRNLWIEGNDVNTEIGFSEGFRIEYATEPRIFGDVNVLRGRLEVFGRRFDLERDSKVTFAGPPMQPALNVTATYKNEIEQVTVHLNVQGEPEKLELKPTSDPPLSETEIYTLLATGHTSLHHGTGASSPAGEAASLLGSVAASQLKKTLSGKLPLDVLSIEAGDSGVEGSKLEAGTYVNDRFYVGFKGRIGADPMRGENSNEVDLEYQLSKRWSINGRYGDARAGGAGVSWRKDY